MTRYVITPEVALRPVDALVTPDPAPAAAARGVVPPTSVEEPTGAQGRA
ncbi:hypothetical protein ABTY61_31630 [Kitasatospora sp. NPDC096128]